MSAFSALLTVMLAAGSSGAPDVATAVDDPSVFSCSPLSISPGDQLILRKHNDLLVELAVHRVGEATPHFLVVRSPPRNMRPLMSPEAFSAATELRADVDSLSGMPWRSGAEQEFVFTTPGEYEIHASTALESEEGSYYCTVSFTGHPRER